MAQASDYLIALDDGHGLETSLSILAIVYIQEPLKPKKLQRMLNLKLKISTDG